MSHAGVPYIVTYIILAVLYLSLALTLVRKVSILSAAKLQRAEPAVYNYLVLGAILSIAMAAESILNIFTRRPEYMTIICIASNILIICVVYLGTKIMWKALVSDVYILPKTAKGKKICR